jgi:collagen type IV alpha-3-binding protein
VDFKGEAITFRETTSAVVLSLNHCLEIITLKEDGTKKKLDKEIDKRRKLEEELK